MMKKEDIDSIEIYGLPVRAGALLAEEDLRSVDWTSDEAVDQLALSLRGQFGIILRWDDGVMGITDSLGSYPIHYMRSKDGRVLVDASAAAIAEKVDAGYARESIFCLAMFGANLRDESFFNGIVKLPRCTILRVSGVSDVSQHEYFSWDEHIQDEWTGTWEEAKECFRERFRSYMGGILAHQEDAPILFSAGVDSALTLALMRRYFPDRIPDAFCTKYGPASRRRYCEFSLAQKHASLMGADLQPVQASARLYYDLLAEFLDAPGDIPPVDAAAPLRLLLMRALREVGQGVVITGDYADRSYCGLPEWVVLAERYGGCEAAELSEADLKEKMRAAHGEISSDRLRLMMPVIERLGYRMRDLEDWVRSFRADRTEVLKRYADLGMLRMLQMGALIDSGGVWQTEFLVVEQLAGVNMVSPFFDVEVLKLALSLPHDMLLANGEGKILLREVLHEEVGLRPEKRAFPYPARLWSMSPRAVGLGGSPRQHWLQNLMRCGGLYGAVHLCAVSLAWLDAIEKGRMSARGLRRV